MQVDFYHLTMAPLDRLLPVIADRVMAGGGRLLIVSGDADQRAALDRHHAVHAGTGQGSAAKNAPAREG